MFWTFDALFTPSMKITSLLDDVQMKKSDVLSTILTNLARDFHCTAVDVSHSNVVLLKPRSSRIQNVSCCDAVEVQS